ncbi:MAG: TIGR04348 family glycosyltransferase [Planctomycetes bacterium]|nr:TIGR04348 family glycosyltransferase [Planctomycetota bacterium]
MVTPAPPRARNGNRVTALRWARILRKLGHRVAIRQECDGGSYDLLIALHAYRSHASIARFRRERPGLPIVVALTGTDLYRDLPVRRRAQISLDWATRIVALQPAARSHLASRHRRKTRVIYQSAEAIRGTAAPCRASFDICVLGHLRPVKDPFRAAKAARHLPASSRIRVLHAGRALSAAMARRARDEMQSNARYRWLGERPVREARRILARSRLMVLTSRMEGGANVVSEALAAGVAILSSRIAGSVGLLGRRYPGYFPAGDTRALARLMRRAETDRGFLDRLKRECARRQRLVSPAREHRAWAALIRELAGS